MVPTCGSVWGGYGTLRTRLLDGGSTSLVGWVWGCIASCHYQFCLFPASYEMRSVSFLLWSPIAMRSLHYDSNPPGTLSQSELPSLSCFWPWCSNTEREVSLSIAPGKPAWLTGAVSQAEENGLITGRFCSFSLIFQIRF